MDRYRNVWFRWGCILFQTLEVEVFSQECLIQVIVSSGLCFWCKLSVLALRCEKFELCQKWTIFCEKRAVLAEKWEKLRKLDDFV